MKSSGRLWRRAEGYTRTRENNNDDKTNQARWTVAAGDCIADNIEDSLVEDEGCNGALPSPQDSRNNDETSTSILKTHMATTFATSMKAQSDEEPLERLACERGFRQSTNDGKRGPRQIKRIRRCIQRPTPKRAVEEFKLRRWPATGFSHRKFRKTRRRLGNRRPNVLWHRRRPSVGLATEMDKTASEACGNGKGEDHELGLWQRERSRPRAGLVATGKVKTTSWACGNGQGAGGRRSHPSTDEDMA